jgi:restriction system protein
MAIPGFQSMFVPFLRFTSDGAEHKLSEATAYLATHFNLSPEDREELLPSGTRRLQNRVGWCCTHLKSAKLIEYTRRGFFRITERGKQTLGSNPAALSLRDLDRFPEHYEWFHAEKKKEASGANEDTRSSGDAGTVTPEEQLVKLTAELKRKLAVELVDQIKSMNPYRFEKLVLDVLIAMGYGGSREEAATVTKQSNDEGIDGLINEDRLGLDRIYVQAKRWQNTVGRPEIQSFVGALAGKHANKGIFITTSDFSGAATSYVQNIPQRVILIDGQRLADLMIEHNVGVAEAYKHEVKKIDSDYFDEE